MSLAEGLDDVEGWERKNWGSEALPGVAAAACETESSKWTFGNNRTESEPIDFAGVCVREPLDSRPNGCCPVQHSPQEIRTGLAGMPADG